MNVWFMSLLLIIIILVPGYLIIDRMTRETDPKRAGAAKTKRPKRDSMRLPYRYADRHLFVYDESVWTGVRLNGVVDDHLSEEELNDLVSAATTAITELASRNETIKAQVRLTHRPITVDEWADELNKRAWDPTPNYKIANRRIAERVFASGKTRPEIVMFVRVGQLSELRKHSHVQMNSSAAISGVADDEFSPEEIAQWEHVAIQVHNQLDGLGITPLTRDDSLWCIRKPLHGHLTPPAPDVVSQRPWGAGQFELLVDLRGRNHRTHLELDQVTEEGHIETSYTAFLVPEDWPKDAKFRKKNAWLRGLARIGYPLEVAYNIDLIAPQKFAEQVREMHADLLDETSDHDKQNPSGDHLLDTQYAEAEQLRRATIDDAIPGMDTQPVIQVAAPTPEALEDIVPQIIRAVRLVTGITLVRPKRLAWRLLKALLPGHQDNLPIAPHHRLQEAEVFGVGLPNVGTEIGDRPHQSRKSGDVLGWRGEYVGEHNGVPVHNNLHVGPARNKGGGTTLSGATGEGKTSFALLKFWQSSESGCQTVALDPKIDFAALCYYLAFGSQVNSSDFEKHAAEGCLGQQGCPFQPINEEFWNETAVIDVARGRAGVWDPFQFSPDVATGRMLAEVMLAGFLGKDEFNTVNVEVTAALNAAMDDYEHRVEQETSTGKSREQAERNAPRPTLWEIVDRVNDAHQQAKSQGVDAAERRRLEQAAQRLTQLRKMPLARLAFAKTPAATDTLNRRRTVFTLRGVKMPATSKPVDSWDIQERLNATMVYAITSWIYQTMLDAPRQTQPSTGESGRVRPKALFVDEAYVLTATQAGRETLREARSKGRSLNLATVLIDQQVERLAQVETESAETDGAGNQTATVVSFRQQTDAEGMAVAELIGRKGQQEIANVLKAREEGGAMENGVALMRDVDGRVGILDVDLVFAELQAATDTNNETRPLRQSVDPPVSVADWGFIEDAPSLVTTPKEAGTDVDEFEGPEALQEAPV